MAGITYGYVRVSTQAQNEARQLDAMREFGVPEENIIVEKLSGKDFQRPLYQQLIEKLRPGDVLALQSIDRLGRNYAEILEQWGLITKERQADIVVLDMPLLDTREGYDLTGRLIADIVLQLFSYIAQIERENIRQRQAEGIAAAKARGVRFGRKPLPIPEGFEEVAEKWEAGEVSATAAAKKLTMSRDTFLRRAREFFGISEKEPQKSDTKGSAEDHTEKRAENHAENHAESHTESREEPAMESRAETRAKVCAGSRAESHTKTKGRAKDCTEAQKRFWRRYRRR